MVNASDLQRQCRGFESHAGQHFVRSTNCCSESGCNLCPLIICVCISRGNAMSSKIKNCTNGGDVARDTSRLVSVGGEKWPTENRFATLNMSKDRSRWRAVDSAYPYGKKA